MGGFFANTRKPEGLGGKLMVSMMNSGHSAVGKWGISHLHIAKNAKILDIGCGGGGNIRTMLKCFPGSSVTGIDYSPVSVQKSRKLNHREIQSRRCRILQGDAASLPFTAHSFDLVTAFETVYFWQDITHAFQEVMRILKPGRQFLICNESDGLVPAQEKWCDIIGGMKIYRQEELANLLASAGFFNVRAYENPKKHWLCVIAGAPK